MKGLFLKLLRMMRRMIHRLTGRPATDPALSGPELTPTSPGRIVVEDILPCMENCAPPENPTRWTGGPLFWEAFPEKAEGIVLTFSASRAGTRIQLNFSRVRNRPDVVLFNNCTTSTVRTQVDPNANLAIWRQGDDRVAGFTFRSDNRIDIELNTGWELSFARRACER